MTKVDSAFPRVFITQTEYNLQVHSNPVRLSQNVRETYRRTDKQPFELVERAHDADIVVFWEEYQEEELFVAPKLRAAATAIGDPEKVFVVSTEDRTAGFLPGIYTSTPLIGWDEHRFRTGAYFLIMNPLMRDAAEARGRQPKLLFTFVGAATALVRKSIFQRYQTNDRCWVQETGNLKFTIDVEAQDKRPGQAAYLEKMLDSAFVLCPRGGGDSSFRLYETMQMGRVPVILSDGWVPPIGPCWQDFSIRIAERSVDRIEEILGQYRGQAEEMGKLARAEWESWFRQEVIPYRSLQWIYDIYLSRIRPEADYVPKWPFWAWRTQLPTPLPARGVNKVLRLLKKHTPFV